MCIWETFQETEDPVPDRTVGLAIEPTAIYQLGSVSASGDEPASGETRDCEETGAGSIASLVQDDQAPSETCQHPAVH